MHSNWRFAVAFLAMGALMIGLVTISVADVGSVLIGAVIAGAALYGVCRAALAGVRLTDTDLIHRGYLRTSRTKRTDVERVAAEVVDSKIVWDVEAPVLDLRDGKQQVLNVLAGVKRGGRGEPSRVGSAVSSIDQWLRARH